LGSRATEWSLSLRLFAGFARYRAGEDAGATYYAICSGCKRPTSLRL